MKTWFSKHSQCLRVEVIFQAAVIGLLFFAGFSSVLFCQDLPKVPPVDFSQIEPSDFKDDELDMPYYLAHFHEVANSIIEEGLYRGYIDCRVWRGNTCRTYNARVLENYLSFAYFYTLNRSWNPYYNHPAVKKRLEAVLSYWLTLQGEEGKFSEYGDTVWNLAATAFATKFMGFTLLALNQGPSIDSTLLKQVIDADRKAIYAVLTLPELYEHGLKFSNQFTNVWSGALAYLKLFPDEEIQTLLYNKIRETVPLFQSPAGYFYERNGSDWGYNLGTHHTNLEAAKYLTKDQELLDIFVKKEQLFYDWLSYNALLEPDDSGFVLNRAIETRGSFPFYLREPRGLYSRSVPPNLSTELAWPFSITREEQERRRREARLQLEQNWPDFAPLREFTPYDFLARSFPRWLPDEHQREEAVEKLPYLEKDRFTQLRMDNRCPITYAYIRRPSYYAIFNSGEIVSENQRYGLGIIYHPALGTLVQSQSRSSNAAWGTLSRDSSLVYESRSFFPEIQVNQKIIQPESGIHNLQKGDISFHYSLGTIGSKQVAFKEKKIEVRIELPGEFTEIIPLLTDDPGEILRKQGRIEIRKSKGSLILEYSSNVEPEIETIEMRFVHKNINSVRFKCKDTFDYRFKFKLNP